MEGRRKKDVREVLRGRRGVRNGEEKEENEKWSGWCREERRKGSEEKNSEKKKNEGEKTDIAGKRCLKVRTDG